MLSSALNACAPGNPNAREDARLIFARIEPLKTLAGAGRSDRPSPAWVMANVLRIPPASICRLDGRH